MYDPDFGRAFSALLEKHGLTAFGAERYLRYMVRHQALRSWASGQLPGDVRKFLAVIDCFPGENRDYWVDMVTRRVAA